MYTIIPQSNLLGSLIFLVYFLKNCDRVHRLYLQSFAVCLHLCNIRYDSSECVGYLWNVLLSFRRGGNTSYRQVCLRCLWFFSMVYHSLKTSWILMNWRLQQCKKFSKQQPSSRKLSIWWDIIATCSSWLPNVYVVKMVLNGKWKNYNMMHILHIMTYITQQLILPGDPYFSTSFNIETILFFLQLNCKAVLWPSGQGRPRGTLNGL